MGGRLADAPVEALGEVIGDGSPRKAVPESLPGLNLTPTPERLHDSKMSPCRKARGTVKADGMRTFSSLYICIPTVPCLSCLLPELLRASGVNGC